MNDYVICTDCLCEQIIGKGDDFCLNCGKSGYLMWADESCQEVDAEPQIIGEYKNETRNA